MREFFDALGSRLRTPILGNYILATLLLNWKEFILLGLGQGEVQERIAVFENSLSLSDFVIYPVVISILFSFAQPYLSLFGAYLAYYPTSTKSILQTRSANRVEIEKTRLELERNRLQGKMEEEIIARYQRDEEIQNIADEGARERLADELHRFRSDKANLSKGKRTSEILEANRIPEMSDAAWDLLLSAGEVYGDGTITVNKKGNDFRLSAGGKTIPDHQRELDNMQLQATLNELLRLKLIYDSDGKFNTFNLTELGYRTSQGGIPSGPQMA